MRIFQHLYKDEDFLLVMVGFIRLTVKISDYELGFIYDLNLWDCSVHCGV